jgi:hypothetical protein
MGDFRLGDPSQGVGGHRLRWQLPEQSLGP